MAVGAVHHHLIAHGTRMRCDLVVESGDAWDVHHFASLIGYGAAAVHLAGAGDNRRGAAGRASAGRPDRPRQEAGHGRDRGGVG